MKQYSMDYQRSHKSKLDVHFSKRASSSALGIESDVKYQMPHSGNLVYYADDLK
ncbi:hypothetical protein [Vibrio parahaemolyticus]|uniref:hypothetical protein n=1 Tax=Vibrio parahaemolyticus TaxID=670 RepID=UPI0004262AAB|nr:hypothetical protein [Vibrio parahaemolyticus]EKA6057129.1 hypothetical protein [Vibrio parahaemolyticus]MBM5268661.1 hypothetical protein [Vibrio parahaemolyticus]MBM5350188.1 hypothetical protein [Vibrio parahaemolyticus]MBM5353902.1 hypothetical protein [Vibrio parahaemolyticus]MBM5357669.1 hypothetical protein [Vibrio parahaemolyticus]